MFLVSWHWLIRLPMSYREHMKSAYFLFLEENCYFINSVFPFFLLSAPWLWQLYWNIFWCFRISFVFICIFHFSPILSTGTFALIFYTCTLKFFNLVFEFLHRDTYITCTSSSNFQTAMLDQNWRNIQWYYMDNDCVWCSQIRVIYWWRRWKGYYTSKLQKKGTETYRGFFGNKGR